MRQLASAQYVDGYRIHVVFNDGTFATAYATDALMVVIGIVSLWALGKARWCARAVAILPLALNLLGAVALFAMHRAGLLVTYSEFIDHWRFGP